MMELYLHSPYVFMVWCLIRRRINFTVYFWRRTSSYFFFLILVCEAIGTAATPGLLCQPRVIVKMIVEKQMECRLARETEVL
jgi:hypothetical protein